MGGRKRKGDKTKREKLVVEFDEKKRTAFLTGFKKRKDERRRKAKEEIKQILKTQKKRIKSKKESHRLAQLEEYESLSAVVNAAAAAEQQQTYELPQHWVTVTEISDVDYLTSTGTYLGNNEAAGNEEDDESEKSPDVEKPNDTSIESKKKGKVAGKEGEGGSTAAEKKKRLKKKRHINFTHTHHKRRKLDTEQRLQLKRKLKRHSRLKTNKTKS